MQAQSFTIEIPSSINTAFEYLSDLRNLREWAPEFCKDLKTKNGQLVAVTPGGELYLRIRADKSTGIIDMYANPQQDGEDYMASRLLALPNGQTIYTVTYIREAGISDEEYAFHCTSIQKDMDRIKQRLS